MPSAGIRSASMGASREKTARCAFCWATARLLLLPFIAIARVWKRNWRWSTQLFRAAITRRRFLAGLGAAGAAIGADAFGFEAHHVLLSRHDVMVPGLPLGLNGLRLAQVTDVHLPGNQLAA